MTKFTEQLHTKGTEIRMSDAERARVFNVLKAKMVERKAIVSPFYTRYAFLPRVAAAFILVIVVSGGTAYASEGSLPGDPLYSVKVNAVEPIEGALQFSDSAKAAWNARVATRRLDEAQALAEKGELTPAISAELAANFTAHASAVASAASRIALADPGAGSDISGDFSASVAERSAAILAASKQNTSVSSAKESGSLVVAIASDEDTNTESVTPALMKSSSAASDASASDAGTLSVKAHAALVAARQTISARNLSKSDASSARAKAASIATRIVKADAEFSIGSTSDAVSDYSRALRDLSTLTDNLPNTGSVHNNILPLNHF